jgi:hypothetical protein
MRTFSLAIVNVSISYLTDVKVLQVHKRKAGCNFLSQSRTRQTWPLCQLSVVQCRYLSRVLTAAAGLHTARTGSGWTLAHGRAAALTRGSALGMRVQLRALLV